MAAIVPGGRFMPHERIYQRQHMFRLWRRLAEHTGVQTPPFKFSSIYRQPKQTLLAVAVALEIEVHPASTNKDIVALLDNYVFA